MFKKLALVFIFFCCSKQENVPSWYIQNQQNTNEILYGYGASPNKDQSAQEALSNLKERIYTSISSKTFVQNKSVNGKQENEYSKSIKMQIPQITIQNYTVDKTEFANGIYYTIVRVEREILADSIYVEIQKLQEQINPNIKLYNSTQNEIHKVQIINNLKQQCNDYTELEHFYNGIGYFAPNNPCMEVNKIYHNFMIENTVQIANTNPLIQEILTNVFSKKFTVSKKSENIITYNTQVKTTEITNSFMSGITINILQHNTPEKYQKHCIGSSSESKDKSIENAFQNCLMESKNMVFEEFFNIK
jgi:hypothetical protein